MQQPNGSYSVSSEKFSVFVPVSGAYSEWKGYEGVESHDLWQMGPEATSVWNQLDLYASNGHTCHDEGWLAFATFHEAKRWMWAYASVQQPAILELRVQGDLLATDRLRLQMITEGRLGKQLVAEQVSAMTSREQGAMTRCLWLSVRELDVLEQVETQVWRPREGWEPRVLMEEVVWKPEGMIRGSGVRVRRERG